MKGVSALNAISVVVVVISFFYVSEATLGIWILGLGVFIAVHSRIHQAQALHEEVHGGAPVRAKASTPPSPM